MKTLIVGSFKDLPLNAKIMSGIGLVCALLGMIFLVMDVFGVIESNLPAELATIVAGQVIVSAVFFANKNIVYKED